MIEGLPLEVPAEERERIYALGLFVTNENGEVLILQNNQTKEETQKVKGQLTVPAETLEPQERELLKEGLPRTIYEEVGYIYGPKPQFRGTIRMLTPIMPIVIVAYEIKTTKDAVNINPQDKDELSSPRWLPLSAINARTFKIGNFDVPLFRTPIVELASNILKAKNGLRFPVTQTVNSNLDHKLFDYLKQNPGPVYPVK